LVRIPLPVTGNLDEDIQRAVEGAMVELQRERRSADAPRPVLVLQFDQGHNPSSLGNDFERTLSVARFLSHSKLSPVKTVAFIPRGTNVKGHAVLIAMACEEIVMAGDAEIGEAGLDVSADESIGPIMRGAYREIAERRRTIPVELALGMLDKELEVHKVTTEVSVQYVLSDELEKLVQRHAVESDDVVIPRGEWGRFTGRQARDLFVKYLADDREELARELGLPAHSLEEDSLLGHALEPRQLRLSGPITSAVAGRIQRMIDDELRRSEVNFICLRIQSSGGSLPDSMVLANHLADLDPSRVRTVAYVDKEARGGAALVALACDHLIMHPSAILGGKGTPALADDEIAVARQTIEDSLADKKSRSWSLLAATIDPSLEIYEYRHRLRGTVEYFSQEEVESRDDAEEWVQGERVAGQPLEVAGTRAVEMGLAKATVESFAGLKERYGLEGDPRLVEPSWAHVFIDALASPGMAMLLLVIGGAALYAELQAPGIGVGAFLAGVAFLLFFWSKYLHGTSTWLEVLLFLGGVCCLLLEIFVLPGFGIFGLGGGLMILASLVLASQTFVLPRSAAEAAELRGSMLVVIGAALGIFAAAIFLRRYLPDTPVLKHLTLNPLEDRQLTELSQREAVVDYGRLAGARGIVATQLTPSGKAWIENQLIDVIADGEVIDSGQEIEVIEVHGNRILVRAV
jgi:membrane-bound ClpP family serine protease